MAPNLTDWWDNQTEWADERWYREFRDVRYGLDVDTSTQNLHLNNSIEDTEEAFGTWPLSFAAAGNVISGYPSTGDVPQNYTYKLAALNGFGLASDGDSYTYLGSDLVISKMKMARVYQLDQVESIRQRFKAYGAWDIPLMLAFHDNDIASDPYYLTTYLAQLGAPGDSAENPVEHYLSQDEFIGYMHASPAILNPLTFTFNYDQHYCKYFTNHTSTWTLELTDILLSRLRNIGQVNVMTDGNTATVDSSTYFNATMTLNVPQGTGIHAIQFSQKEQLVTTMILSANSQSISLGNRVILTGRIAELNGTGIANASIMLSYGLQGFSVWIPFASTISDIQGSFNVSWIPQATGQFIAKVEWAGDSTHIASNNSTTLSVTA